MLTWLWARRQAARRPRRQLSRADRRALTTLARRYRT
jgi:hypothetical protein